MEGILENKHLTAFKLKALASGDSFKRVLTTRFLIQPVSITDLCAETVQKG